MTPAPTPTTLLVRAPTLQLRVDPGSVEVHVNGIRSQHGPHTLRLLEFFSTPRTLADALDELWESDEGAARWMELSSAALALCRAGALVAHEGATTQPKLTRGYGGARVHVRMLDDVGRTKAYLDAIAATVRPGDVVVDVGTGTGILAMAAARAGARHVYAIEASGIADVAQAMFEENGFADRITLVRGWSTNVTLPERADVMVAELVGMDPFDEQICELTHDARRRLLTASPRLVPHGLRVLGLPVSVPDRHRDRTSFTPEATARWKELYGFGFGALLRAEHSAPVGFGLKAPDARTVPTLAGPILIAETDLTGVGTGIIDCHATATATATGVVNGLLLYFDLYLAPGHTLTTAPDIAEDTNHWGNRVVLFPDPVEVAAGERFLIHVERRHGRFSAWCEAPQR